MTTLERYQGEVALITGASAGVGAAVARDLAAAGLRVALVARNAERLEELARALRAAGGEALALPTDLTQEADIARAFATLRETWGGVRILVNSAGLGYQANLLGGETAQWREMLELNVLALCICTREAVADMRAAGDHGHVVHLSSMAAHRIVPGGGLYGATKYAVRALTESLRQELHAAGSAIRVGSVSPGIIETGFGASFFGSAEAAQQIWDRVGPLQPRDVAEAVRFLLTQPAHVQVHDVLVRPTRQAL